jgi:cephalosporin hydroxylase
MNENVPYRGFKPIGDLHVVDQEVFNPDNKPLLFEQLARGSYVQINHTTPFYGIMLYSIIRATQALNVVEIGVGFGWCSYFMAMAVRENIERYNVAGRYLGIDIDPETKPLFDKMIADGFPVEYKYCDSATLKTEDFLHNGRKIDLIFQDGDHHTEQCLKEIEIFYPAIRDQGEGYLITHDSYAWCEEYYNIIKNDPRFKWEHTSFMQNYGFTIFRKMDNYDYKKQWWGETPPEKGQVWR